MVERHNQNANFSRRSLLRNAGVAGVLGTVGVGTLPEITTADLGGTPVWTEKHGDQQQFEDTSHEYVIEHGLGLEYYGSYINASNVYRHEFRMDGTGCGRARRSSNDPWQKNTINAGLTSHEFTVDASDYDFISLIAGDDAVNLGCTPSPSDPRSEPDYTSAAKTAVLAAFGRIHPSISTSLAAYQIYNALVNTHPPDAPANVAHYPWDYGYDRPFDTSHFFRWEIEQRDECRGFRFDIESIKRATPAGYTRISRTIQVGPQLDPRFCDYPRTASTFEDTIRALDKRFGVQEIPQKVIKNDERLRTFADGGPLYKVVFPVRSEPTE